MKRHYIIDGYNALFHSYHSEHGSIQKAREHIISDLADIAEVYTSYYFTVVFDAHEQQDIDKKTPSYYDRPSFSSADTPRKSNQASQRLSSRTHFGHIEIIYTGIHETADEFLCHYFRVWKEQHRFQRKDIQIEKRHPPIVVTSDKHLGRSIASLGYTWISIEDFFSSFQSRIRSYKKRKTTVQQEQRATIEKEKSHPPSSAHHDFYERLFTHGLPPKEKSPAFSKKQSSALFKEKITSQSDVRALTEASKPALEEKPDLCMESHQLLPSLNDNNAWESLFTARLEKYEDEKMEIKKKKRATSSHRNRKK